LAHRIERFFEVNVDAEYAALQALRLARDLVELQLVEISFSSCSSTVLARSDKVFCFCDNSQTVADHVVH
jgi:predicted negative regulator of RcsB-dependent stress response